MPRLLRYFLVWLSCTAVTVSVVFLTVRFVVHSTAPLPPTAHARPTSFDDPTLAPSTQSPSPASHRATSSPKPARPSPRPHRNPAPSPHPSSPRPSATGSPDDCQGGVGTHTVQSHGGQVTIRWGAEAVCLVSAVPAQGFTTRTSQSAPDSLTVTFEGTGHRSQIVATLRPAPKAVTTETSW